MKKQAKAHHHLNCKVPHDCDPFTDTDPPFKKSDLPKPQPLTISQQFQMVKLERLESTPLGEKAQF